MQTFTFGNKRIDVEEHIVTHVRTVKLDHRGNEVQVADRRVYNSKSERDFSRQIQVDHFLLPPPEWRPQYVSIAIRAMQPHGVVLWRGDSRDPDEIFRHGFSPRTAGVTVPVWRAAESDIHPLTAVCVSVSIFSAVLFPLINEGEVNRQLGDLTWVYGIHIMHGDPFFNTQWVQRRIADGHIGAAGGARAMARENARAGEVAVQAVLPSRVLVAVRAERQWHTTDWTRLGRFRVKHETLRENSSAQSAVARARAATVIREHTLRYQQMRRDAGDSNEYFDPPA